MRTPKPQPRTGARDSGRDDKVDAPHRLDGGEGYGCQGWTDGQVVRTSDRARERVPGTPEYLTVVKSGSRYYREEGMSFGVGDEQGRVFWASCREATPEEIAPVKAARDAREQKRVLQKELADLARKLQTDGERPEQADPQGDRILDDQNIYGGGSWWMVSVDAVWYVRNNGADGDNWAHNNVRTGGAGAIGWTLPAGEIGPRLREIAASLESA